MKIGSKVPNVPNVEHLSAFNSHIEFVLNLTLTGLEPLERLERFPYLYRFAISSKNPSFSSS